MREKELRDAILEAAADLEAGLRKTTEALFPAMASLGKAVLDRQKLVRIDEVEEEE